jgi:carbon storage regulator CsrA
MLVLSRKVGEQILLPELGIVVTVVAIHGRRVRLGITAPAKCSVARQEVGRRDSKPSTELVDPGNDVESS